MGFIKTGANLSLAGCMRGRLRGGILHFNKMISSPVYSSGRRVFIHKVHPFNRIHTQAALSYLPTEEVEPMRQYSGEITAGCQGSSFHNQNHIHALQHYILRNRKMMSWCHRLMGPKNSIHHIFSVELKNTLPEMYICINWLLVMTPGIYWEAAIHWWGTFSPSEEKGVRTHTGSPDHMLMGGMTVSTCPGC